MSISVKSILSITLGLALVMAFAPSCTRKLMPGVWVTYDARVVEATPEVVRSDMEFRLARNLAQELDGADPVRVRIEQEPQRLSRRGREREDGRGRWRWTALTVHVEMGGIDITGAQVRAIVKDTCKPHLRDTSVVQVHLAFVQ